MSHRESVPSAGQHCNSAGCSVSGRSSLLNLEHTQGAGGRISCSKSCGKALLENGKQKIFLLSNLHIYSYMIKLITSDHLKTEVCLFMCQTSLGHCRSKDSKPRSSPAERLFYQRQRLCPNTQNTFALPFLVQVVLCSHSQPCIPMKHSLELILNSSDGKGSSPFLQLIQCPVSQIYYF